jgi:biopolymer transport protein ExbD
MAGGFDGSSQGGKLGADLLHEDEITSAINVTPLVDVVLVLLVIFMITAPTLYRAQIPVKLPQAQTGKASAGASKEPKPLEFTLKADGTLFVWGKEWKSVEWTLPHSAFEQELKKQSGDSHWEQMTADLLADEDAPHGKVIRLMDILRKSGLTKVSLSVNGGANGSDPR